MKAPLNWNDDSNHEDIEDLDDFPDEIDDDDIPDLDDYNFNENEDEIQAIPSSIQKNSNTNVSTEELASEQHMNWYTTDENFTEVSQQRLNLSQTNDKSEDLTDCHSTPDRQLLVVISRNSEIDDFVSDGLTDSNTTSQQTKHASKLQEETNSKHLLQNNSNKRINKGHDQDRSEFPVTPENNPEMIPLAQSEPLPDYDDEDEQVEENDEDEQVEEDDEDEQVEEDDEDEQVEEHDVADYESSTEMGCDGFTDNHRISEQTNSTLKSHEETNSKHLLNNNVNSRNVNMELVNIDKNLLEVNIKSTQTNDKPYSIPEHKLVLEKTDSEISDSKKVKQKEDILKKDGHETSDEECLPLAVVHQRRTANILKPELVLEHTISKRFSSKRVTKHGEIIKKDGHSTLKEVVVILQRHSEIERAARILKTKLIPEHTTSEEPKSKRVKNEEMYKKDEMKKIAVKILDHNYVNCSGDRQFQSSQSSPSSNISQNSKTSNLKVRFKLLDHYGTLSYIYQEGDNLILHSESSLPRNVQISNMGWAKFEKDLEFTTNLKITEIAGQETVSQIIQNLARYLFVELREPKLSCSTLDNTDFTREKYLEFTQKFKLIDKFGALKNGDILHLDIVSYAPKFLELLSPKSKIENDELEFTAKFRINNILGIKLHAGDIARYMEIYCGSYYWKLWV